ncbi:MAG: TonB-dependent receptor [Melioribacteraceae bacterium]
MKAKAFLFLFVFSFANIYSQNHTLNGKIIHKDDSSPLLGVNVIIEQLKLGTQTNLNGEFEFKNIPAGNYKLNITYIGHKTVTKTVVIPLIEELIIPLEEGTVDMHEIVVTGNPLFSDPKDMSQSIVTIANLELQTRANNNIGQILNNQPGISMRSNGTAAARPVIRGFSNNRILILENGLRTGDLSNSSDDHAVSSDGSAPEKIEVLRGPASLLYGSNAMGGVINIITEAIPNYVSNKLNGEVALGYSSNNREYLGSTDIHYGKNKFGFHLNYFNRKGDEYSDGTGTNVFNSDQKSHGYQLGTSFFPSFGVIGVSMSDYSNKYGIPSLSELVSDPEEEGPIMIDMTKRDYRLLVESSKMNSFITNLSFKGGFQDYKHQEIARTTGEVGTAFGLESYSGDLSFKHAVIDSLFQGVFGFWAMQQEYSVNGEEAFTPNANYFSIAGYLFEQVKLSNLNLQFGARFESNKIEIPEAEISDTFFSSENKNFNSFSGSIGLVYKITDNTSLFANLANAFRSPTIEELSSYAIHGATGTFDIGSRDLKNENNIGFDLGLRVRMPYHSVEFSSYINSVDNYIYRKPTDLFYDSQSKTDKFNHNSGFPVFKYTQGNALLYGFEVKAIYEESSVYSTVVIMDYVRGLERGTNNHLPQIPPFRFSVEQKLTADDYWAGINWKLALDQNEVADNETPTKGYGLLDAYVGVKLFVGKFVSLATLKIENMLDQPYKEHLSAIKEFAYMPGRTIRLTYKFLF